MPAGRDREDAGFQDMQAERDAFAAGRDLTVVYQYVPGAESTRQQPTM